MKITIDRFPTEGRRTPIGYTVGLYGDNWYGAYFVQDIVLAACDTIEDQSSLFGEAIENLMLAHERHIRGET